MDRQTRLSALLAGDGSWIPPDPLPAATMVLVRQGQVLLMRRSKTMAFAPGMHVFPGGGVNDLDRTFADPLRACAIRETFEEVAIQVDECRLIDRWVTPELEERRYDVSFYLAVTEIEGALSTTEADEMRWLEPTEALTLHRDDALPMLRPTAILLEGLASGRYDDEQPIVAKLPRLRGDGSWDVVEAFTGEVIEAAVVGPRHAETDGGSLP